MAYDFRINDSPALLLSKNGEIVAKIDFHRDEEGRFFLDYLWVDPLRRGQGLARKMIDHFADHVRGEGQKITPICGVARSILTGSDEYDDLL